MGRNRNIELDKWLVDYINNHDTFWLEDIVKQHGVPGQQRVRILQLKNKIQCCTFGRGDSYRKREKKFLVIDKITEQDLINDINW